MLPLAMAPSALGTARVQLWQFLKILDYREARTVICRLRSRRDFVPEQTLESSQISPEALKVSNLSFNLGQVLLHECHHVLARSRPLIPHSEDTAYVGERHCEGLRPADEA